MYVQRGDTLGVLCVCVNSGPRTWQAASNESTDQLACALSTPAVGPQRQVQGQETGAQNVGSDSRNSRSSSSGGGPGEEGFHMGVVPGPSVGEQLACPSPESMFMSFAQMLTL